MAIVSRHPSQPALISVQPGAVYDGDFAPHFVETLLSLDSSGRTTAGAALGAAVV